LRIKKNNLTLKGAGFTKVKLVAWENFPIKLKKVGGFTLEGFFIKAQTKQGFSSVLISDSTAEIRHCLITSDPDGYGIFCNKGAKATIEHNTIVGNKKDGGIRLDKSCSLTIKNNIIVNNGSGIHNKDETGTVNIYHNNVWGNGKDYVNCRPSGGNISADPQFVNPDAEDYRLSSSSPCLKAGENGVDIGPNERVKLAKVKKKQKPKRKVPPPTTPAIEPKPKPGSPPQLVINYELPGTDEAGRVDAVEGIKLNVVIKNTGEKEAQGVKLEIAPASPGIKSVTQELGDVWPLEDKVVQVELSVDPQTLTQQVRLEIQISEQEGHNPAPKLIEFELVSALTTGVLEIKSIPEGASIYLNEVHKGETPLTIDALEPGTYKLELKQDTYGAEQEVLVEAGRRQDISIQLEELFGSLELSSQPQGAMLYIDGEFRGESPLTVSDLSIGSHQLKLVKYTSEAILRHEAQVAISLGANQLNIAQLERISPPVDMVFIPGSEFEMGSKLGENNEQPPHQVYLDNFYIDKYEVSNDRYKEFVQATGNKAPAFWGDEDFNQPKQPVVGVSWQDADTYCKWADKRLPSEAKWEKAARGTNGPIYPWGDEFSYSQANIIVPGDGYQYTAPVGSYPEGASPYGALNMAGNAAEWCADWYALDYYANSSDADPKGPASGESRVIRGGSWNSPSYDIRSTSRWRYYPDTPRSYIGFRCVWQP
jgi:iron(II)-dependent oxidoreductase